VPPSFSRTLRALDADTGASGRAGLFVAGTLLVAFGAWFGFAPLTVYASSDAARIEVDRQVRAVQASTDGTVASVQVSLGQLVRAGDVLVTFDARAEVFELEEARARRMGLDAQRSALDERLATAVRAREYGGGASAAAIAEAEARVADAEVDSRYRLQSAERARGLRASGAISDDEFIRMVALADGSVAAADAATGALRRLAREHARDDSDRGASLAELRTELARLGSECEMADAAARRLEVAVEQRTLRSLTDGVVAQLAPLVPGQFVETGEVVATVVPEGTLRVVASFPPAESLGRVAPGQAARLSLDGFPWTEYGTLPATVVQVAGEVRDGQVRVELALDPGAGGLRTSRIELRHGLPGRIDIAVEQCTPATLVLRIVGALVDGRGSPSDEPLRSRSSDDGAPLGASPSDHTR
jgi:multidrug resistance efflux pump